ncbi:MAG: magnesium transporter [Erysipelotrichaceae bacterium]
MENKLTFLELEQLVKDRRYQAIRDAFDYYNLVDLTNHVENLDLNEILLLFKILRKDITAEIFTYLSSEKQEDIITSFTGPQIAGMLENLYTDDIVDFLEEMPANVVKHILTNATAEQRAEINLLLSYPEDSAGSIMTTDFVELKASDTVKKSIQKIKQQGKVAETISYCYVVDVNRVLAGSIKLRDILFADEDELISDLMDTDIVCVTTTDDQEHTAALIRKYDVSVLPVVNNESRLIGVITADDIIDVITEETTEDIQKMAAVIPTSDSYLRTGVMEMTKSRIAWLLVLMVSATFTGLIIQGYEVQLASIPALAAAIPMIMSTGGNAGCQSSTMVIRGIAIDHMRIKDFGLVLWKELRVSLGIGLVLFVVNFFRLWIFMPSDTLMTDLVISLTLFLTVILANLTGGILPLVALVFKQDPAAMASPLITTIVDALALIIYFNLAMAFLGNLM